MKPLANGAQGQASLLCTLSEYPLTKAPNMLSRTILPMRKGQSIQIVIIYSAIRSKSCICTKCCSISILVTQSSATHLRIFHTTSREGSLCACTVPSIRRPATHSQSIVCCLDPSCRAYLRRIGHI